MLQGFLSIVLHSHLPFVRHPEHEYSLEEKWFYEAMLECYLPVLRIMEYLEKDGIDFRLTFTLSPTLLGMMEDELLSRRFIKYMENLQNLSQREVERTINDDAFHPVAVMYRDYFAEIARYYNDNCGRRPARVYRRLQEAGYIEIMTTGLTHGFLPLLELHRESVYTQISAAVDYHTRIIGTPPRGFWLPECAYSYGIDDILAEVGIQYFLTDTHGVLYATPRPKYGIFSPIITESGVAVFARDSESSQQVWSSKEGYPGDYHYREFYRDIGFDLELDYIGPHLHPPGLRSDTGIKYYKISGTTLEHKQPYDPEAARARTAEHAGNFMFNREKQVEFLNGIMGRPPVIVAPYDAELFGHWWFEGPLWLDYLCRKIYRDQDNIKMITPGGYLDLNYPLQISTPCPSSWGDKGYFEVWLNGSNDWLYRHLHRASREMTGLVERFPVADGATERALNQAARELVLAQSSDWPFIMTTDTMVEYARKRAITHLQNFRELADRIKHNDINEYRLREMEDSSKVFDRLDYCLYQNMESTVPVELCEITNSI